MNPAHQQAVDHINTQGYHLFPDAIAASDARAMAEDFLKLHDDPQHAWRIRGDQHYQTLFGMLNLDDRVWRCAAHDDVVAVARCLLGDTCRVVEACSKPARPGSPAQNVHIDSAANFARVPDIPWMINTIWMLTDFTQDNGATGVVPMSHTLRRKSPPPYITADSSLIRPITGRAGSVLLWHSGLIHLARANTTTQARVGLNIAYYPRWMNNWVEAGHQPVTEQAFARMPKKMQSLCPGRLGERREELYEEKRPS